MARGQKHKILNTLTFDTEEDFDMFIWMAYDGAIRKEKGFHDLSDDDKLNALTAAFFGMNREFIKSIRQEYDADYMLSTFVKSIIEHSGCAHIPKTYSKGENAIKDFLDNNGINYISEYSIKSTIFSKNYIRVDFYLPDHNTFIEFNGRQHYIAEQFGATEEQAQEFLKSQQKRDDELYLYCFQNGIELIEIPYTEIDNITQILTNALKTNILCEIAQK